MNSVLSRERYSLVSITNSKPKGGWSMAPAVVLHIRGFYFSYN